MRGITKSEKKEKKALFPVRRTRHYARDSVAFKQCFYVEGKLCMTVRKCHASLFDGDADDDGIQ